MRVGSFKHRHFVHIILLSINKYDIFVGNVDFDLLLVYAVPFTNLRFLFFFQSDYVNSMKAARDFSSRISNSLKVPKLSF